MTERWQWVIDVHSRPSGRSSTPNVFLPSQKTLTIQGCASHTFFVPPLWGITSTTSPQSVYPPLLPSLPLLESCGGPWLQDDKSREFHLSVTVPSPRPFSRPLAPGAPFSVDDLRTTVSSTGLRNTSPVKERTLETTDRFYPLRRETFYSRRRGVESVSEQDLTLWGSLSVPTYPEVPLTLRLSNCLLISRKPIMKMDTPLTPGLSFPNKSNVPVNHSLDPDPWSRGMRERSRRKVRWRG